MKMTLLGLLLLPGALWAQEPRDTAFTAGQLVAHCRIAMAYDTLSDDNPRLVPPAFAWHCLGYVQGAVALHGWMDKPWFCRPERTTLTQVIRELVNFADKHPEEMRELEQKPMLFFIEAMAYAFPCEDSKLRQTPESRAVPRNTRPWPGDIPAPRKCRPAVDHGCS